MLGCFSHACLQVAFLNDGSFLVSDGYCNSRVVLYRPDGSFGTQYELPKDRGGGHAPGGSGMAVAHSVVVDECDREVAVADREFSRVHRFDLDTKELKGEGQQQQQQQQAHATDAVQSGGV